MPYAPHPHTEATYNLLTLDDGAFAVEVVIPERKPTKVSGFDTREKAEAWAEAWIETRKANIATGTRKKPYQSWARRNAKPSDSA
jgi:hypothetical protein